MSLICVECDHVHQFDVKECEKCGWAELVPYIPKKKSRPFHDSVDQISDLDQTNPVDLTSEEWQDIMSDPDYDMDNDHSMDN